MLLESLIFHKQEPEIFDNKTEHKPVFKIQEYNNPEKNDSKDIVLTLDATLLEKFSNLVNSLSQFGGVFFLLFINNSYRTTG